MYLVIVIIKGKTRKGGNKINGRIGEKGRASKGFKIKEKLELSPAEYSTTYKSQCTG